MDNALSLFDHYDDGHVNREPPTDALPRDVALLALGEIQGVGHITALKLYNTSNLPALFKATRDQVHWAASKAEISSSDKFADDFVHRELRRLI